jgi:class 3 adenylate cyclase
VLLKARVHFLIISGRESMSQLADDKKFQQQLSEEIRQSGRLRSLILAFTMGFLFLLFSIVTMAGYSFSKVFDILWGFEFRYWIMIYLLFFVFFETSFYVLFSLGKINNFIKHVPYFIAFFEVSLISTGLFLIAKVINPLHALNSHPILIYGIMVMFLALFQKVSLCVFAGALVAIQYFGLSVYFTAFFQADQSLLTQPLFHGSRSLILLLTGIISGFVAWDVKKRMINSFNEKYMSQQELLKQKQFTLEQEQQLTAAYERFVPKQFLHFLEKESIVKVELGDHVEEEMSLVFSDIRDFTSLSEVMTPRENFKFINSYLSQMEMEITKYNGFVDKYIGDAIMALFKTSADDAIKASIGMVNKLIHYNEGRSRAGYSPISIGVGVNTGLLMLGTVGAHSRMDGTVISDAVNLASRTEGLNKMYGTSLLITENTYYKLKTPDNYLIRTIDRVQVKGKTKPVTIFEVFSGDAPKVQDHKRTILKTYNEGISLYYSQEFNEAKKLFQKCLETFSDKASQIYIDRCNKLLESGIGKNWSGITQLDTK